MNKQPIQRAEWVSRPRDHSLVVAGSRAGVQGHTWSNKVSIKRLPSGDLRCGGKITSALFLFVDKSMKKLLQCFFFLSFNFYVCMKYCFGPKKKEVDNNSCFQQQDNKYIFVSFFF